MGDDDSGLAILDMLEQEGVETSGIAVLEDRTTTVKTRLLGAREGLIKGEQLLLRWDIEDDEPISNDALRVSFSERLKTFQIHHASSFPITD